ncbi:MAG: DUF2283 domain-containing protein [Candidatus Nanoarchaeia archaeon]
MRYIKKIVWLEICKNTDKKEQFDYIYFHDPKKQYMNKTKKEIKQEYQSQKTLLRDDCVIDYDKDGKILGIEFYNGININCLGENE